MFILPAALDAYLGVGYIPTNPPLPSIPLPVDECCEAVDPALGRCQMPAHQRHDTHRLQWDDGANVAWWRTTPPIIHPI